MERPEKEKGKEAGRHHCGGRGGGDFHLLRRDFAGEHHRHEIFRILRWLEALRFQRDQTSLRGIGWR